MEPVRVAETVEVAAPVPEDAALGQIMVRRGDHRAARPWFRSAVGFFEAQPTDPAWPDWGRADAHAWLGRTLARLGNTADAREQYRKALDVEPEFAWVRDVLLPDLDDGGQRDAAR